MGTPRHEGKSVLTAAKRQKWRDVLEITDYRKANPHGTYEKIAEKLKFSVSKVSNVFADQLLNEVPQEIKDEYYGTK